MNAWRGIPKFVLVPLSQIRQTNISNRIGSKDLLALSEIKEFSLKTCVMKCYLYSSCFWIILICLYGVRAISSLSCFYCFPRIFSILDDISVFSFLIGPNARVFSCMFWMIWENHDKKYGMLWITFRKKLNW